MRKIITSNMISIDGYLAGPGGDLSWHIMNDEFHQYAIDTLNNADALLFGRVTYELMAGYWPDEDIRISDPIVARQMNGLQKFVFSKTLEKADWENTTLLSGDMEKNVREIKQQPGKDIMVLGSGTIVSQLTELNFIDEYRFIISPVILGAGILQFTGSPARKKLELTGVRQFGGDVVMLSYQPNNQTL